MKTVRWGIVGCGDVTEHKSGPAFAKARGSRLVAVMRRDASKARDYAERHGVARWYDDARALVADPEVDAVYVATPPSSHAELCIMAANAGKPVYVEKPMARTHAECQAMIEACRAAAVPLFVAYYRRALPRFVAVRDLVAAGRIGHVRLATVLLTRPVRPDERGPGPLPWRVLPEIAGGGHFVDLGSHVLDLLDFWLGPVTSARGIKARQAALYPAEDALVAALSHERGALSSCAFSFSAQARQDRIELIGDRGRISLAAFADEPVVVSSDQGDEVLTIAHPEHIQQPMIQAVVDELLGLSTSPCHGEDGARTSLVIDRLLA